MRPLILTKQNFLKGIFKCFLALSIIFCFACSNKVATQQGKGAPPRWSLNPNTIGLNSPSEIVIRGENLFACELITGSSVKIVKKEVVPNGTAMKVVFLVNELGPYEAIDVPGQRLIQVRLGKEIIDLDLYVVGEKKEGGVDSYPVRKGSDFEQ